MYPPSRQSYAEVVTKIQEPRRLAQSHLISKRFRGVDEQKKQRIRVHGFSYGV